jgi:hypothetical protein
VRVDRNQKSIPVGVGELMSLHIGAVIDRAIHIEAVIVLRSEILDVLQYDAFAVSLGGGQMASMKLKREGGLRPPAAGRSFRMH